ncbi:phosphoribosylglycinamide formyltransferase [Bacteroides sp. 214]|uniref:phosphoribosylglycinamide formyltransferase n=1 Tax=Bacteroides sp. 214 TaxID=2302935 RepID=UPI0013D75A47|nr:phosphoribosylglycinamide formyltransferase [Bacteroides sp. 214]
MRFIAHFSLFCAGRLLQTKMNIAILASGSGSNAENIARHFSNNKEVRIALIITNKKDAYVLERARTLNIASLIFPKEEWITGERIMEALIDHHIDFVVLAGFLLRIPDVLLHKYPNKIINIHPSLLPKFGGKGMYGDRVHQAVVAAQEKETGITIHYVNEYYDEGEVIEQITCPVLSTDTPEQVAEKVHALEYAHFPRVIEKILFNH